MGFLTPRGEKGDGCIIRLEAEIGREGGGYDLLISSTMSRRVPAFLRLKANARRGRRKGRGEAQDEKRPDVAHRVVAAVRFVRILI